MAQSVERRIGSAEVPGPIPGASCKGSGRSHSLFAAGIGPGTRKEAEATLCRLSRRWRPGGVLKANGKGSGRSHSLFAAGNGPGRRKDTEATLCRLSRRWRPGGRRIRKITKTAVVILSIFPSCHSTGIRSILTLANAAFCRGVSGVSGGESHRWIYEMQMTPNICKKEDLRGNSALLQHVLKIRMRGLRALRSSRAPLRQQNNGSRRQGLCTH